MWKLQLLQLLPYLLSITVQFIEKLFGEVAVVFIDASVEIGEVGGGLSISLEQLGKLSGYCAVVIVGLLTLRAATNTTEGIQIRFD